MLHKLGNAQEEPPGKIHRTQACFHRNYRSHPPGEAAPHPRGTPEDTEQLGPGITSRAESQTAADRKGRLSKEHSGATGGEIITIWHRRTSLAASLAPPSVTHSDCHTRVYPAAALRNSLVRLIGTVSSLATAWCPTTPSTHVWSHSHSLQQVETLIHFPESSPGGFAIGCSFSLVASA